MIAASPKPPGDDPDLPARVTRIRTTDGGTAIEPLAAIPGQPRTETIAEPPGNRRQRRAAESRARKRSRGR